MGVLVHQGLFGISEAGMDSCTSRSTLWFDVFISEIGLLYPEAPDAWLLLLLSSKAGFVLKLHFSKLIVCSLKEGEI